jgi:hypothetical protein
MDSVDWIHLASSCEHDTEPSGSIKGEKCLDQLNGLLASTDCFIRLAAWQVQITGFESYLSIRYWGRQFAPPSVSTPQDTQNVVQTVGTIDLLLQSHVRSKNADSETWLSLHTKHVFGRSCTQTLSQNTFPSTNYAIYSMKYTGHVIY